MITASEVEKLRANDPRTPLVDPRAEVKSISFVSPAELAASVPPEPPWVLEGYVASGAITLLPGKPKVGKSTLTIALVEAIAAGASTFLGRQVRGGPVVLLSEEGASTLAQKLSGGDIRVLSRDQAWPKPSWLDVVNATLVEAKRVKAVLVVVDTFAFWGALLSDREKDAGAIQAAMEPLYAATREGLAVLLLHHQRKGGGEDGEATRGSNAIVGAADILVELERVSGGSPRQRRLVALSRYTQTPGMLLIDHDPATGAWGVIGEGEAREDARAIADRMAIIDVLAGSDSLTREELESVLGTPARQWHAVLKALVDEGVVEQSGKGVKGDPYRFKLLRRDSAQAPAQNRAASPSAEAAVSAALPVREQQKQATVQAAHAAPNCAEDEGERDSLRAAIRSLASMSEADAEAEWRRLETEHGRSDAEVGRAE